MQGSSLLELARKRHKLSPCRQPWVQCHKKTVSILDTPQPAGPQTLRRPAEPETKINKEVFV